MDETKGIDVQLRHQRFGEVRLHNITEIHYRYTDVLPGEQRVAFESDIHGTGITYDVVDVLEFTTSPAKEVADMF